MDIQCNRWLTSFVHHPGRPKPSPRRAKRGILKKRPARKAKGEGSSNSKEVLYDTPTDGGRTELIQPGDIGSTENHCNAGPSTCDPVPELGSQERFDEEVMIYYHAVEPSLASQFLNLDDEETSASPDQMVTTDIQSPTTSSTSLTDIVMEDVPEWDIEPTSLLFDMKKFETVTDLDGGEKTIPWPWVDFKYETPAPLGYLDPEEYAKECQFAEIEEVMREELMEVMVQETILAGKNVTTPKQRKEGKGEKKEKGRPSTVAFNNQAVRGRTIYSTQVI